MVEVSIIWVKQPTGFLKVIALAAAIVCLGLQLDYGISAGQSLSAARIVIITPTATAFVLTYIIFSFIVDGKTPGSSLSELVFDILLAALCITTGGLVIDSYKDYFSGKTRDSALALGSIMIGLTVVLIVDAFFTFKKR